MVSNVLTKTASVFICLALYGCGGEINVNLTTPSSSSSSMAGSSSSSVSSSSSQTFNIYQAYVNDFRSTYSKNFSVSGTSSGYNVTGSGSLTVGAYSGGIFFEGYPAFQRTTTVTGTISANGQSFPLDSSGVSYTDTNFIPLGSSANDEYIVITSTPQLPTTARVNDTGSVYTANRYTSSNKFTSLGTIQATYLVEADTANTALVKLILTYKNTLNTTTKIATAQYRITTSSEYTRVKETLLDYINNQNLLITY